jgi:hypothetical protein
MKTRILILGFLMIFVINQNYGQNASLVRKYVGTNTDWNSNNLNNYVFIKMNENSFSAYYFVQGDEGGYEVKYLKGNFEKNVAKCKILGCKSSGVSDIIKMDCGTMNIYLKNNKSVLMMGDPESPYDKMELTQDTVYLSLNEIRNIRESPLVTAKVITKIDFADAHVELLDIGDFEKIGNFISFWYKVKVNGLIGWVYGG